MKKIYKKSILIRESTNPRMNLNGGDYDFWTNNYYSDQECNNLIHTEERTSSEFEYCCYCGSFGHNQYSEKYHGDIDNWLKFDENIRSGNYEVSEVI
jgi:hypothetical protein